mmetsp:Transcript_32474/g.78016  ORF Transcript_32474/g.78016 Transcript_32474/m.78016 type:complete len:207 (-) Transcript_32474:355-975(-)
MLSQSLSRPELHFTPRVRTPYPQEVEHTLQGPTSHLDCSLRAFLARPTRSIPLGSGTTKFLSFTQSGACSHCMLHTGLGQSLGRLHSHWHTGSGQTVLHPMDPALEQSNSHFGSSHRVVHFGHPSVELLLHSFPFGQNILHTGSAHCTWHFSSSVWFIFGHRVSQVPARHTGLHPCSQTGWVQFQVQWGTQLLRVSLGTSCTPGSA